MMRIVIAAAALVLVASGCMTQKARAPVDDRRPTTAAPKPMAVEPALAPAPVAPPASTYTVKRGDTLYSIALELGIDYRDLARWNKLDDTKIRVGQALRIVPSEEDSAVQIGTARGPGALEVRPLDGAAAPQPPPAPGAQAQPQAKGDAAMKTSPKALRLPYSEQNLALLSKGEAQAAAPKPAPVPVAVEPRPEPAKPAERDPDAIDFIWPVRGRVLAGFSEPNSKGVDISGKIGDPVVAAAQGKVMYTGTGIRGYGKLIVIKHDNGFNSVYAHNREILVKEGQNVNRGQKIAELGDSDSDAPKLHFEIRKSGKPVDPLRYLPPG
jgi:lipoprotein NlpD